jgi:hypothetical protein
LIGGQIYYRETYSSNDLSQIKSEIYAPFFNLNKFEPTRAYVITYDQVSAANKGSPQVNNTFQTVITTDDRNNTFLILNYFKLNWPTIDSPQFCLVGYNGGNGDSYTYSDSYTSKITNISNLSNVNVAGKWVFRIDQKNERKFSPS